MSTFSGWYDITLLIVRLCPDGARSLLKWNRPFWDNEAISLTGTFSACWRKNCRGVNSRFSLAVRAVSPHDYVHWIRHSSMKFLFRSFTKYEEHTARPWALKSFSKPFYDLLWSSDKVLCFNLSCYEMDSILSASYEPLLLLSMYGIFSRPYIRQVFCSFQHYWLILRLEVPRYLHLKRDSEDED